MKLRLGLLAGLLASLSWFVSAEAGVITDGSQGVPRTELSGPAFALDERLGSVNADNGVLYFSLESLSFGASETLTVSVPDGIDAVIIAVTGDVAVLDGVVSLVNPPEQLIIAAPAGLLFGDDANLALEDGVKVVLASADRLVFGDDILALQPVDQDLPSGVPTAYVVPPDSGGDVRFTGTEMSFSGSDISVLGHRIVLEAETSIAVADGWLDIATEARDGVIPENDVAGRPSSAGGSFTLENASLSAADSDFSVYSDAIQLASSSIAISGTVPSGVFGLAGNVIGIDGSDLTLVGNEEGANLLISGQYFVIENDTTVSVDNDGGGGLTLIGNRTFTVTGSSIISHTASPEGQAELILRGPDIAISGASIEADDPTENGAAVRIEALEATLGSGLSIETDGGNSLSAGSIHVDADQLVVDTGAAGIVFETGEGNESGGLIEFLFVEGSLQGESDLDLNASGQSTPGEIRLTGSNIRLDQSNTNIAAFSDEIPASFSLVSERIEGVGCRIGGERGPSMSFESTEATFERCTLSSGNAAGSSGDIVFTGPTLTISETRIESIGTSDAGQVRFEENETLAIGTGSFVETRGASGGGIHSLAGNVIGIVDSNLEVVVSAGTAVTGDVELHADLVVIDGSTLTATSSDGVPSSLTLGGHRLDVLNEAQLSTCSDNENGSGDIMLDFSTSIRFDADSDRAAATVESCNEGSGAGGNIDLDTPTVVYYESPTFDTSAEDGSEGSVRTPGPNTVLIRREVFDEDENCPSGGQRILSGLDDGDPGGQSSNGRLEVDEVDDTIVACDDPNGDGPDLLVQSSPEPAGDNCIDGGVRVVAGPDDGDGDDAIANNGILETTEIEDTFFGCFGEGVPTTLVELSPEPAGDNCSNGGQRIDIGLDNGEGDGISSDGVLQLDEIDTTQFFCSEASDFDRLVLVTELDVGDEGCMAGGTQIDTGLDDGDPTGNADDGELQPDEVDETILVCSPSQRNDESGCSQVDSPTPFTNVVLWFLALAFVVRRRV